MQYGFNAFTKYFTHTSHYYVIYYNNFKPILYVHRLHKLIYWLRYVTYFTPINPLNFNFSSIRHTMYSHKLIGKFIQTTSLVFIFQVRVFYRTLFARLNLKCTTSANWFPLNITLYSVEEQTNALVLY